MKNIFDIKLFLDMITKMAEEEFANVTITTEQEIATPEGETTALFLER